MIDSDFEYFTQIMVALSENFGNATFTPMGLNLRFEAMREFTINQISKAATELIKARRSGFMPTVGEIIEVINLMAGCSTQTPEEMAEIQAGIVLEFLRQYGRLSHPEFKDQITSHLMTARWKYYQWASTVMESDLIWWKKEFIRAYKAYAVNATDGKYIAYSGNNNLKQLAAGLFKSMQ